MDLRIKSFEEYKTQYEESVKNPSQFWASLADKFKWAERKTEVLKWNFDDPDVNWFRGSKLNITENMLDRYLEDRGDQIAFYWEPNEPGDPAQTITYSELHKEVCKMSNGLRSLGIGKGDRICIYMPMVLESLVAVIACARIGAIHSIVFAGFSSSALSERIRDANATAIITADGLRRGNKTVTLKETVDEALKTCPSIKNIVVLNSIGSYSSSSDPREIDYHDLLKNQAEEATPEVMDAEDILYILYTSGSTGKPKGVVHTIGGYMLYTAYSFQNVFQYEPGDVFWCTADIGWVTGHSYIIYGPLLSGATSVLFEGIPTYPDGGRFWQVCEKYKVNQFYTAPTAIRSLMGFGLECVEKYDLSALKVIGSVGEPINDEAWHWYHEHIGKKRCPLVDTWWQTETGGIMISGLGNHSPMKPTFAGYPLPGIQPVLLNNEGQEITEYDMEGYLCIKFPWPAMLRTTYGDHERCRTTYFSHYKGYYFTGDGAKRDAHGMYRIIGRVDDVINVSGHRFGTAEIEDAIDTNEYAIEAAVVGFPHDIKGQGIYAYVVVDPQHLQDNHDSIISSINNSVVQGIGKIARPDKIQIVSGLPKTRSGKIMRRILRKIAEGERSNFGDTSTLLDPAIVNEILLNAK